ncbi:hypothetical protein EYC84_004585 [Monilinia fructicola]|uniref:Peptidase M48 domain-containing protein n=1 Tax=Monilinia fructicola TaxID=38448 RepID=A0A5M9K4R0_MONFR|nr:hypothetical protein EYC84_004585 [Monilinia fructicola]
MPPSYLTVLLRGSRRATLGLFHSSCTQSSFSTHQQRSFRSQIHAVYKAVYEQRRVIPEKKDPKKEEYSLKKLKEALADSRETRSPLQHVFYRFQLVSDFYKNWTRTPQATGKTHFRGRGFLGPHTPEVKRARGIAERLFLVLPDDHIFRRVEVVRNPGGYNACATWDGVIILDLGILNFTYSDSLLACLIAHEMAHHLLNHNKQRSTLLKISKWCLTFQAFYTDLTSFPLVFLERAIAVQHLEYRKMCRAHEFEADEEGMMIMSRANYNWNACIKFVENKIEWEKKANIRNEDSANPALSTHPTWEQRLERLKDCRSRRAGEVKLWWKENQLAVFDRKERLEAEKKEMKLAQNRKRELIAQAKRISRAALSSESSNKQTAKEEREKGLGRQSGSLPPE